MTPDEYTNQEMMLDVGGTHQLYIHDWGNSKAKTPIIFLHGGPGAGCNDGHKQPYNPELQRVIFFDQRGSGKSLPAAELSNNTTSHLVDDINRIADKLQISKFILHGRSWGSCLALCYALQHPQKVSALVIGGVFIGTQDELDWEERGTLYDAFFPDVWQHFLKATPSEHHQAPVAYHMKTILSDDSKQSARSAYTYTNLILGILRLDDRPKITDHTTFESTNNWLGLKVEAHYKLHRYFVEDKHIINNASELTMPIWIIQGRYDVMCTPQVAYQLDKELPNSRLIWVTAGHSGGDRAIHDSTRTLLLSLSS